ncbi:hypothetical protein [Roseisalinus antarcticus]|uniref:Uncharacterized protein n=1 Tax=Roseisalinus antarcticus TaxID=254357 RepID=A0A1Y5TDP2_9RHOB|nr:hypothetical protein [Roseisalinus antarcticus]SLN59574.1 hypothetical protein ROA7023_02736 [Roseisalinus antarcticus]
MFWMRWLMRMRKWRERPPSAQRVKLVLGLIALLVAIAAVERWVGWPDWATLQPTGPRSGRF